MKRAFLTVIFMLILIAPVVHAISYSVGVSPSVLDLGDLEKDSPKIGKFNIVTPSDEELLIQLETMKGDIDFFRRDRYENLISNYSEEDPSTWVEFLRNPVVLKTSYEQQTKGGYIRGWKEIELILNVPKDAEPGYHLATLRPLPLLPKEVGWSVSIRAIATISLLFNVKGNAIRDGEIVETYTGDYVDDKLEVNVLFKNTGTVSIVSWPESIKIYDQYGREVASFSASSDLVKPEDTKTFKALWDVRGLTYGEYIANSTVCYTTGCTSRESIIDLYAPKVPPEIFPRIEYPAFPGWLLLIVVVIIISYMIYRRG